MAPRMATNMIDLGVKRKQLHAGGGEPSKPMSGKDWENEKVYPCLNARGEQAVKLGAESLEEGDYVRQEVLWKVARRRKVEEGGNTDYDLELEMVKGSDLVAEEKPDTEDEEDGDSEGEDAPKRTPSAAMSYIQGLAGEDED